MNLLNNRAVLKFLCRHVSPSFPGVWRLGIGERVTAYRFPVETIECKTVWGFTLRAIANDMIGNRLYFDRTYQPELVACLLQMIRPGTTVVDAGANIGILTVLMAEQVGANGRVIAIEPGERTFACLKHNVESTGFHGRVTAMAAALGESDGTGFYCMSESDGCCNYGGSRVLAHAASEKAPAVPVRSLDSIWEQYGRPPIDIIKMDIEGAEPAALRGASRLFHESPPKACVVEINRFALAEEGPDSAEAIWNFFMAHGYQAFDFDGAPMNANPEGISDVLFRL